MQHLKLEKKEEEEDGVFVRLIRYISGSKHTNNRSSQVLLYSRSLAIVG
jgi:hypothetical protein